MDSSNEDTVDTNQKNGFTRKELFFLLKDHLNDNAIEAYEIIEKEMSEKLHFSYELKEEKKRHVRKILYDLKTKWHQVHRKENIFLDKFSNWLSTFVPFINQSVTETDKDTGPGRPSCSFGDSSGRTKRRKTEQIRAQSTSEELAFATQMSLRAAGRVDAATVLKDISSGSPSKALRYRKSLQHVPENMLSGDEALSILIENKLSKSQYKGIRAVSVEKNCKLYPPYKHVLDSKKKCYPDNSKITVTESGATVTLQALLDHTVERILLTQLDVIKSLSAEKLSQLELICKWGCDGTSGQSTYKQKFSDEDGNASDANIFFISFVPLQIVSVDKETNPNVIIWKNPRPSSPRFCRPIKIQFLHETAEATKEEVDCIKEQENNLVPLQTIMDGKEINVNYKLALTMVDGKVCNSITNTSSSQRCYLCHATSKEFNDIDKILQKPVNEDNLQFGLSSLHAWIRFFECCLHLSYKLEIKKWQGRKEDKQSVKNRKEYIQKGFRQQLGLIVDQPKQGYGSTNDGNTARRFFENSTISATITGVDEELIKRFHIILQVISCGFEINVHKFQEYTVETARKFVELYPWFYMPTTVHKILIHGYKIIDSLLLPIGQMSEEAQESCNKYIKKFREDFARKCSRTKNMEDVFLRLLVTSDPLISSLRKLPPKKQKSLSPQAVQLLVPPSVAKSSCNISLIDTSDDDSDDSNYSSDSD